jgi:hypothetical protein
VDKETRAFLRSQVEKRPLVVARPVRDGTGAVVLPFRRLDGADPAPGEVPVQLHLLKLTAGRPDLFLVGPDEEVRVVAKWVEAFGAAGSDGKR